MSLSHVSIYGFIVLNAILAWGVAFFLWRRIKHRPRAVHLTVATMAAIAFAFGAAWFSLVHVRTFEPLPDNVPRGNNSLLGRVLFAGVAGILLLVLASVVALMGYALWESLSGRQTGPAPNRRRGAR